MIELTEQMRDAVNVARAEDTPVVVASVSEDGTPDLAFKGSTMVFDDQHLAYWERSLGQTLNNLEANPHVTLLYRSAQRKLAWKFFGTAELHRGDDIRQQIMNRTVEPELAADPERKGVGVLIRVDRVIQGRNVIMQREG